MSAQLKRIGAKADVESNGRRGFVCIAVAAAVLAVCCTVTSVSAGPEGGSISAGSGSINQPNAYQTLINQYSNGMVIDWNSFNLSANESVQFNQPGSSSVVLNQIYDQNPSQIFGSINANGIVFLANPNGLVFGAGATVNVAGLVASGLAIDSNEFMAGNYNFAAGAGETGGYVVNHGLIQAATGGSVSMLGGAVSNEGLIIANYGQINLAAGDRAVLDFNGDRLIQFEVTGEVLENSLGLDATVSNSGTLHADGGTILLKGAASQSVFDNVVNNSGLIQAQRIENRGGEIYLTGDGGAVEHSGSINVSGVRGSGGRVVIAADNIDVTGSIAADASIGSAGQITLHAEDTLEIAGDGVIRARGGDFAQGGEVKLLGNKVGLFDRTVVDVSGGVGGGEVLVGGDYQGGGDVPTADFTYVGDDVRIKADATLAGDGGRAIVWADDTTRFFGTISARGGNLMGGGGFVETSAQHLLVDGVVDVGATQGNVGLWLLDPVDIRIEDGFYCFVFGCGSMGASPYSPVTSSVVTDSSVNTALGNGDVTILTADGNITVGGTLNLGANDLTLSASSGFVEVTGDNVAFFGDAAGQINGTGGDLLISARDFRVNGTINLGASGALRVASTSSNGILMGDWFGNFNGWMAIDDNEMARITAGTLQVGAAGKQVYVYGAAAGSNISLVDFSSGTVNFYFGNASTFNAVSVSSGGTVNLDANITATGAGGVIDLGGANSIRLGSRAITLTTSNGAIDLAATNGLNGSSRTLTLNAGGGGATLGTMTNLSGLDVNTSGALSLTGDITATGASGIDFAGATGGVLLNDADAGDQIALTSSAGNVLVGSAVTGTDDLVINAGVNDVSLAAVGAGSLQVISNETSLSDNITGTNGIDFSQTNSLVLRDGVDDLISMSTTDADIELASSVTSDASGGQEDRLMLNSGTGTLQLNQVDIRYLQVVDAGDITLNGDITATQTIDLANGANILLQRDVTLDGANLGLTVVGTIGGGSNLEIVSSGSVSMGAVDPNSPLRSLTIRADGQVVFGGDVYVFESIVLDNTNAVDAIGITIKLIKSVSLVSTSTDSANDSIDLAYADFSQFVGGGFTGDVVIDAAGIGVDLTGITVTDIDSLTVNADSLNISSNSLTVKDKFDISGANNVTMMGDMNITTSDAAAVVNLDNGGVIAGDASAPTLNLVVTSDGDVFLGGIGSAGAEFDAVTVAGSAATTTHLGGDIFTTADITFANDSSVVLTGDAELNVSAGPVATVNLNGVTVTGLFDLTLDVGAGNIALGGLGTDVDRVGSLTLVCSGTTSLTGDFYTASGADFSAAADIDLTGSVLIDNQSGSINLTGGTIDGGALELQGGSGSIDLLALNIDSISATTTGQINLAGNISTTDVAGIVLAGNVSMLADIALTTLNDGEIDLGGAAIDGNHALTLDAGAGNVSLGDMGQTVALDSLAVTSTGVTFLGGDITVQGVNGIDLSAAADIDLVADSSLVSINQTGVINLQNQGGRADNVDGNFDLLVDGGAGTVQLGAIGQNNALSSFTVNGTGLVTLEGDIATRGEGIDFGGVAALTLIGDTTMTSSASTGTIALDGGAVDGDVVLTLDAGSGGVELGSMGENSPLKSITASGTGQSTLGGNIIVQNDIDLSAATNIDLVADTSLDTSTNNGAILLTGGAVDGNHALTLNAGAGTVSISGAGANSPLAQFAITQAGNVNLSGILATQGSIDLSALADVNVVGNLNLDTTAGDGDIKLSTDIDGGFSLTLNSGAGDIVANNIGQKSPLSVVRATSDGSMTLNGNITAFSTAGIDFSGVDALLLSQNIVFDTELNDGTIRLNGGDVDGAVVVTLNAGQGAIYLGNMGRNTALDSVDVNTTGTAVLSGTVNTQGANGIDMSTVRTITLEGDTHLNTSASDGQLALGNASIDGTRALTITTGTTGIALNDVGQSVALTSLTLQSTGDIGLGGDVATVSDINITGAKVTQQGRIDSGDGNINVTGDTGINMVGDSAVTSTLLGGGTVTYTSNSGDIQLATIETLDGTINLNSGGSILNVNTLNADLRTGPVNLVGDTLNLNAGSRIGVSNTDPIVVDVDGNGVINLNFGSDKAYIYNRNGTEVNANGVVVDGRSTVQNEVSTALQTSGEAQDAQGPVNDAADAIAEEFYLVMAPDSILPPDDDEDEQMIRSLNPDVPMIIQTQRGLEFRRRQGEVESAVPAQPATPQSNRGRSSRDDGRTIEWIRDGFKYRVPKQPVENSQ